MPAASKAEIQVFGVAEKCPPRTCLPTGRCRSQIAGPPGARGFRGAIKHGQFEFCYALLRNGGCFLYNKKLLVCEFNDVSEL